jgi:hypothetical protein
VAEKIMNERTTKEIQGWRRPKRRKRTLIRKVRLIATDPKIAGSEGRRFDAPRAWPDDASATLAKCLRPVAVAWRDENRVDETLTQF